MRLFFTICWFLLSSAQVCAQQVETLLGEETARGGFGAPLFTLTSIAGEPAVMIGGGGAGVVNHRFFFGGIGQGLVSSVSVDGSSIRMGYGGVWMGAILRPYRLVHGGFGLVLGAGSVSLEVDDRQDFFLVEPQMFGELNVSTSFRMTLGILYRWVTHVRIGPVRTKDIRGMGLQLGFKFGAM